MMERLEWLCERAGFWFGYLMAWAVVLLIAIGIPCAWVAIGIKILG